jgi:hypothetical protein
LLQNINWVNLQSDFVTAKKCMWQYIFLIGPMSDQNYFCSDIQPNLVGHCPMSDSNLQPWSLISQHISITCVLSRLQTVKILVKSLRFAKNNLFWISCNHTTTLESHHSMYPPYIHWVRYLYCVGLLPNSINDAQLMLINLFHNSN